MKKHHHLSLIGALVFSPFAFSGNSDDIWTYQNNNGVTLEQACHNRTTCERIYANSYYTAFVNNHSETGCNIGDLLIVQHKSRSFQKMATGTCSNSASIEVRTYEGKKNIDIMIGDRIVTRYPLDTWTIKAMNKEGKYTPMQQTMMNYEKSANAPLPVKEHKGPPIEWQKGSYTYKLLRPLDIPLDSLSIDCSIRLEESGGITHSRFKYQNSDSRRDVDEVEVNGKRLSAKINNQEAWTQLVRTLLSASKITAYINNEPVARWLTKPTQLDGPCNYYRG
ncbi:hypothetical protein [Aeromonas media]|uniref:hypothetical protein n=1 Tax=Aeromonas media TaxID=651 RepID=UPI001117EE12|nr:hypothetical protein [Aeromonas media]